MCTCGVAYRRRVPCAAARRHRRTASAIVRTPSSPVGTRCEWTSTIHGFGIVTRMPTAARPPPTLHERLRGLALGRDADDLRGEAELLEPGDHPAARIEPRIEAPQPVEGRGRERVVVVVPALAERDQAQQPDVPALVLRTEAPTAPEVADRVDRERDVVEQEDADRAAP